MANTTRLDFIKWLKENQFHQYKDGTWYSTKERPYVKGQQRKFYEDEELNDKFIQEVVIPNIYPAK